MDMDDFGTRDREWTRPATMQAVRLHRPGGAEQLELDTVAVPEPAATEVLLRVHAAAITRDELEWPVDRLPAIPSYEVSGVVVEVAHDIDDLALGAEVYALTPFDRDGAAAEYVAVPAGLVAPRPRSVTHVVSAALPLAGLSAWQGLFDHGRLEAGERVLIHGAAGGVGHVPTQLARERGARVLGTASGEAVARARALGADEVIDVGNAPFEDAVEPVDLVFDTVGGDALARSASVLRDGGRLASVAEEPPRSSSRITTTYFVVEPNREQLLELARLVDEAKLVVAVDSVYPLAEARSAFERVQGAGKHGKVVLQVHE
jgi:NADPH:quinone reductase-like Zn-dependent oxidoreductase